MRNRHSTISTPGNSRLGDSIVSTAIHCEGVWSPPFEEGGSRLPEGAPDPEPRATVGETDMGCLDLTLGVSWAGLIPVLGVNLAGLVPIIGERGRGPLAIGEGGASVGAGPGDRFNAGGRESVGIGICLGEVWAGLAFATFLLGMTTFLDAFAGFFVGILGLRLVNACTMLCTTNSATPTHANKDHLTKLQSAISIG